MLIKPYIVLVQYERDKEINDRLSSLCDTRIIWGGDATIADIRKSELLPRATEITFADRYSLAVIDADAYMQNTKDEKYAARVASDFYNDTYLSDQNACTSPRVVVWVGKAKDEAKKLFWSELHKLARGKYNFQQIQGVDKMSLEYAAAASGLVGMKENERVDNILVRIQVADLKAELMDYRGNSGYFYEYDCEDILSIRDFCNNTHCQTLGLVGDAAIVKPLLATGIRGIDRVVPVGHTMDYDLVWDGYNLVERLTRTVRV